MYRYNRYDMTPLWYLLGFTTFLWILTEFNLVPNAFHLYGVSRSTWLSQPWTIVSSLFIHAGFNHILSNMITLYFFGSFILSIMSWQKAALIYFGGGILGNLFFLALASPFSLAVGASGAIFALGGTLVALRPRVEVYVFPIPAPIPLWIAVLGGFALLFLFPGVAWEAHLGGLVLGLVAGYFMKQRGY